MLNLSAQQESSSGLGKEHQHLSEIVAIQRDVAHAHHDLPFAMHLIAERTQAITSAEGSVIEMLEGEEMVYRAASGTAAPFLGLRLKAAGSLSGRCVSENAVLKCDNAEMDPRVDKEACRKVGVSSMVVVPLTREKKAVGVLKVLSSRAAAFNQQDVTTLELLAGVLSAALSDALVNDQLRQSEAIFRTAMEHSPIGMALLKPDGQWFKVNKAFCTLLGYAEEELLQTDFKAVTHPDDTQLTDESRRQIIAGEIDSYRCEKRYIQKNGRVIWVILYASLVKNIDGSPQYFIAQIEDITARKEVEKLKDEFISTVSHELRTPLTSIYGSLGLIASGEMGKLPEDVIEMVSIAHRNSGRLVRIVNDILDIEKIGSGKLELNIATVTVLPFLQSALENNRSYGDKFGIRFVLDKQCVQAQVMADPDLLMQIVTNLMSNAAKFSPSGDEVLMRATREKEYIRFEVEDHGGGIPETFRSRIFGKFTQADSSDTRRHEGTGLGLNITKQLVELMKGKIGFTTETGKGTVFYFTLPEAKP